MTGPRFGSGGLGWGTLHAVALVGLAFGCKYESVKNEPYAAPEKNERTFQKLKKKDPETGVVVREWTAYIEPGKRSVKHGEEVLRYPDGSPMWTRSFDFGEPAGEWTSWYEHGGLRSQAVFAGPDETSEMSFWHPNGQLSARGPARDAVREGEWTLWHSNGVVAARGAFAGSLRQGEWVFWDEEGQLLERVVFEAHKRVEDGAPNGRAGVREASAMDLEQPPSRRPPD